MKLNGPPDIEKRKRENLSEHDISANKDKKEKDFETIKKDFSIWVDDFLKEFYENGLIVDDYSETSTDPISHKIEQLTEEKRRITPETKELTLIFAKKVILFCKNLVFKKDYDKKKVDNFYYNLHRIIFGWTPNIFENLNIDFLQKMIVSSEINETYKLRNVVDTSGETTNDLSWSSSESFEKLDKNLKKLSDSKKISAIKELANTAMTAYEFGAWAYPAFKGIVQAMQQAEKTEASPLVSFVFDFELRRIKNFSNNIDIFEDIDSIEDYEPEDLHKESTRIKDIIVGESKEFFSKNDIVPKLDNVYYSGVSKDYGSIISSDSFIPFALVKNLEKSQGGENIFSSKEIMGLKLFLKQVRENKDPNTQEIIDIADIYNFLKNKDLDLIKVMPEFNQNLAYSLSEARGKMISVIREKKEKENNVYNKIDKENFNKTKELFDFVDKNFDSIFTGDLAEEGQRWINFKKEKYNEGLYDVIDSIYIYNRDYSSIFKENEDGTFSFSDSLVDIEEIKEANLTPSQSLILKFRQLKNFHRENWASLEKKTYEATKGLKSIFDKKVNELEIVVKKLPKDKFFDFIQKIIIEDSKNKGTLPIINYDGFTKDKEFNPLGNEDFSHLIKILHTPEIRNYINNRLKIKIEDLFLREQIYFLKFLSTSDKKSFKKLEKIFKKQDQRQNDDFLKSFLSMSGDESIGNKILELGEKLPKEVAEKVFAKYGEIIDNVNKITEFAKDNFTKETENNPELVKNVEETLYKKGKLLLSQTYDDINNKKEKDPEQDTNLLHSLEEVNSDIILFASLFKELHKENPDLELSEIKNTEVSLKNPQELSQEEITEMEQIYKINKQHWPKELLAKALDEFKNDISENKGRFYILKVQNKIVSFSWFNDVSEDRTYCGYFNVRPEARSSDLGQSIKKVAYKNEGLHKTLECYVFEDDKALVENYRKNYGFEIEKENCDPTGTGKLFYKLVRPAQIKEEVRVAA